MEVCSGSRACTKHLSKVNQASPTESEPSCRCLLDKGALETDRCPHTGVSKVGLSRMAVPVSCSLGGGAEHAHCLFIRNRTSGPDAVSNQTPRGSGHDVYARQWCSSVSQSRQRHKGMTCLSRLAHMAPVSPHAHRVRPIFVEHSIGVSFLSSVDVFQKMPSCRSLTDFSGDLLRQISRVCGSS
jgi:hypothetical protein